MTSRWTSESDSSARATRRVSIGSIAALRVVGAGAPHAHQRAVHRVLGGVAVAYDVLRDRDAAEDAVHGALMRVWSAGAYHPERGPLLPYLIACVRREALDAVRGSKRRHLREVRAGAGAH